MKKIFTLLLVGSSIFANAQAYKGKSDLKFNVGASIQNGGTGIMAAADYGLGENFSIGAQGSYLLGGKFVENLSTEYRLDLKLRLNANLSSVLNVSPKLDVYPGLNLGFRNFGGHLGARYFFSDGFGLFSEFSLPIAQYEKNTSSKYNYGAMFNIGASFNID